MGFLLLIILIVERSTPFRIICMWTKSILKGCMIDQYRPHQNVTKQNNNKTKQQQNKTTTKQNKTKQNKNKTKHKQGNLLY